MTPRAQLTDEQIDALRRQAEPERRGREDRTRRAARKPGEQPSQRELLDSVLEEELPRYAEALDRLDR